MNITDEINAVAARKYALDFHKRNGIKSINDLTLHAMEWADLNKLEKDSRKSAGVALDRITDNSTDEDRQGAERAVDAFTDLMEAIGQEKDERTFVGSKEARSQPESQTQLAGRPGVDTGASHQGGDVEVAEIALRSDQSVKAWARARSNASEHLRGMNAGQFLRAMVVNDKTDQERRALSEATDSAGGYTVPDILSSELIDKARAQSVLIQAGAHTVPLTSDSNTIAKVLTDATPAWRLEAGLVANDDATFGPVVLTPRSLAVQVDISAELMADSLNLGTALPDMLAKVMAVELDRVGLIGTGVAPQPLGITATSGIGSFAQDGVTTNYVNLSKARTGILSANRGPVSAFIMHPREEGAFVDLADNDGQPMRAPKAVDIIPMLTTTSLPIDGGAGSDESTIIAGNFTHMLIGIRSALQVELIKGPRYLSNLQYTMIAHLRADVAVEDPAAFYIVTGAGRV